MEFLNHSSTKDCQWQAYKQLELIPDSASNPYANSTNFTFGMSRLLRGLVRLLLDELVEEQQVEYLERCWALNEYTEKNKSSTSTLQRLWVLMN